MRDSSSLRIEGGDRIAADLGEERDLVSETIAVMSGVVTSLALSRPQRSPRDAPLSWPAAYAYAAVVCRLCSDAKAAQAGSG